MKIFNRKYRRDYQEIEKYEVGIALSGAEVKSVRAGRIRLEDSFVKILGSEVYLINAEISIYEFARPQGYDLRRTRKLLLHKKEIIRLKTKLASVGGLTIVPVSCYNKAGLIKLEIALAKGRKGMEKKLEKRRDIEREQKREAKEYLKS
ncbi:SsrA-binding protein [Candidatus Roizmanbacteria bacterium RIFCSPHIGHO2_02_FULL_38_11]|uniref:SsrA-binding protein n=1 Tax=Candidatus Roizmanbacteria bacterium RIFCSPHIGHO2_02_FULL_38_11 TaxID=1802039 RepID=A0A1F7GYG4_9BACT|nr:MAG: SsrA-binding protein [Candidatus Roizmanbacteria bacterium RIFCSPHIGHO2_02_FULL_38_11]